MKLLVLALLFAILMPLHQGQAQDKSYPVFIPAEILRDINAELEREGAVSRIGEFSLTNHFSNNRLEYVKGNFSMTCGPAASTVNKIHIQFLVGDNSELSDTLQQKLKNRGFVLLSPERSIAILSSQGTLDFQRSVARQLFGLALRICLSPPDVANYLALSLWAKPDDTNPVVAMKLLDQETFTRIAHN